MADKTPKVVGYFEWVSFPGFGLEKIKAKIDTGAYSGALHCTKIYLHEGEKGTELHFSPFDHPEIEIRTGDFITKRVRSSNGSIQSRYFITTQILVQQKPYQIQLSLADRSEMRRPVLIGRKFLRQYGFLVDVRKGVRVSLT